MGKYSFEFTYSSYKNKEESFVFSSLYTMTTNN